MAETLKTCPFCGRNNAKCHVYQASDDSCESVVICGCGARVPEYESPMGSRDEAIAAWNRRPADPVKVKLVKALRATRAYVEGKPSPFATDHECRWCDTCVDQMNALQKAAIAAAEKEAQQ